MAFWSKKNKEESEHLEPGFTGSGEASSEAFQFHDNEPTLRQSPTEVKAAVQTASFTADSIEKELSPAAAPVKSRPAAETVRQDAPEDGNPFVAQTKAKEDLDKEVRRVSLRRRLIGAVVLLAALAVAAPFVLDNTPPPPTISIPLRVPAENGTDVAQLQVPGVSVAENAVKTIEAATAQPKPLQESTAAVSSAAQPVPQSQPEKGKDQPISVPVQKEDGKKQEQAAQKEAQVKNEEIKRTADAKKREQDKAKELQSVKTQKGSFFVQVVATADNAKAQQMRSKIVSLGLPAYTEQIVSKGSKVTRVRIGPYKNAKAAEEARAKLLLGGFSPGKVQQEK
jgi:cell division septation protein DedD